jgi:hydroxymethylglutaryl-CoA reductase
MRKIIPGFSKLSKEEKIRVVASYFDDPEAIIQELKSFNHPNAEIQKKLDEFSENTIANYYFPYGIVPNVLLNGKVYMVPMAIEESSVVAAASKSAKFWADKGGFKAQVIDTRKIGQVHFIWNGEKKKLQERFEDLKHLLIQNTTHITANMQRRGGGILDITLVDMTLHEPGYYQLKAEFETCDSMGANFINSCLEEFALILKDWIAAQDSFSEEEKQVHIIMSILSNYTPDCLVKAWVQCPIDQLGTFDGGMTAREFAWKFEKAVRIAKVDVYRATTHNKGIYNGIDAVVLATGNDFRAVEACGHAYAARNGKYTSLTDVNLDNDMFTFTLTIPMALGVVGGLTNLHPLVKRGMELLGNPSARELMMIAATIGLANNFAALKSLITTGIQKGHMKMHLLNILNHFNATEEEKEIAMEFFKHNKVSFSTVRDFITALRRQIIHQS